VSADELLTYTFTFSNSGAPTTGVTITADTPPNTTFDSAFPAPASAPSPGGTGTVTWNVPDLPFGGSGSVSLTVLVDSGLPDGTSITIAAYTLDSALTGPVTGPDLTVTVQANSPLVVTIADRPDPVAPGDTLTYTVVVANHGRNALTNIVLRELFDPDLTLVSAVPPPDPGTTDQWTIPFMPKGGSKRFSFQLQVNPMVLPGTLQRNFARVIDSDGHAANSFEDTLVVAQPFLTALLDDLPDPAQPDQSVVYVFTYSNPSATNLTGVVINAVYDPDLTFVSAFPPPDPLTTQQWTIGSLPAGTAGRIFVTLSPPANFPDGSAPQVRMSITADSGTSASAIETTVFTQQRDPYDLTITGIPKNPSLGINPTVTYSIRVGNVTADTATNVQVIDSLPTGLVFLNALPPPATESGNTLTWNFPTIASGAAQVILLRTALDPLVEPGTSLQNLVTVTDAAGHLQEASFLSRVKGVKLHRPPLTMSMVAVRRTFPGSQVRFNISVKNTGLAVAPSVVLTDTLPPQTTIVLSTPPPSASAPGQLSWNLGSLLRSGKSTIRLTVKVNTDVVPGTVLTNAATATDANHNTASASSAVSIVAK